MKKLLGKSDIEDALRRLDKLTQEEARMATAEVLKVTQRVDGKVTALIDGTQEAFSRLYSHLLTQIHQMEKNRKQSYNKAWTKRSVCHTSLIYPQLVLKLHHFSVKGLRRDLQRWLSPPDPSTNHNIARKAHYKGTATWFFEGSMFEEWMSSATLLWVHGKRMSLLVSGYFTPY